MPSLRIAPLLVVFFVSILSLVTPAFAQSSVPLLMPGDQVHVSVFGREEYETETHVDGEGEISVIGLGRISVEGLTERAAEQKVAEHLRQIVNLSPHVTLRVVMYRQVAVLGYVSQPGLYDYLPSFTVFQALAAAGGHFRAVDGNASLAVEIATERARITRLQQDLQADRLRQERLQRQIDNEIFVPDQDAPTLLKLEAAIAQTDRDVRAADRVFLTRQMDAINNQIETVEQVIAARLKDEERAQANALRLEKLFQGGLANKQRADDAKLALSNSNIDVLDNQNLLFTALQSRAEVELMIAALDRVKSGDRFIELRDTTARMAMLEAEIAGAKSALNALQDSDASMVDVEAGELEMTEQYMITRIKKSVPVRFKVAKTDFLEPGDVLEVERVSLGNGGIEAGQ
jgi:protein involved in polysaccharide export with SLBB domain